MPLPAHAEHHAHRTPPPPASAAPGGLAVVIPATDEAATIAETVRAAKAIPGVDVVVVVDDGSRDDTLRRAGDAGALALRHPHPRGRAAAIQTGAARVARLDAADHLASPRALLLVDADLGSGAGNGAALAAPVMSGEADMTVAVLAPQEEAGADGRGLVVGLSRLGIRRATGWEATQPLSGMRCLTREAFEGARPLAKGWGAETGLTIDVLLGGYRVTEIACDLQRRVLPAATQHGAAAQHRAAQYRDVAWALVVRRLRRATPLRVLRVLPHKS